VTTPVIIITVMQITLHQTWSWRAGQGPRRWHDGFVPGDRLAGAALYTRLGQPAESRRVLHVKERDQRTTKTTLGRAWGPSQDLTVGYGYQHWRAALWFTALLIIGSIVFAARSPQPQNTASRPHFNPVAYTLDLLLPVVDLGQKHAFNPTGTYQWFSYRVIAAGWILVTTIAAGIARVLRANRAPDLHAMGPRR
jgi:hypothetical protein